MIDRIAIGSRAALVGLAMLAVAATTLAAPAPLVDLPLLADRQLPMVQAMFGDKDSMPCMIDLGAQFNTMPVALGAKTGVEGAGAFTSDGAGITRYTRRVAARVSLGGSSGRKLEFYLRDVRLNGHDGPQSVCILGQPYIKEFTWDLDGVVGRLRLFPRKTAAGDIAGETTKFKMRDGFMTLPVTLDGKPAQAFVDTGASLSEINRKLQAELGVADDDVRLGDRRGIVTLHRAVRHSATVRLDAIVVAGHRIDAPEPMLQLADSFLARFFGRGTPAMLLGWDILGRSRFVFDWAGRTVSVSSRSASER